VNFLTEIPGRARQFVLRNQEPAMSNLPADLGHDPRAKAAERLDASWPTGGYDPELARLQAAYLPEGGGLDLVAALSDPSLADIALVSSFGAESAVLLHLVSQIKPDVPVIFLDTGRHFPATLDYVNTLQQRLGLNLQRVHPQPVLIATEDPDGALAKRDPDMCCTLRKTFPLADALAGYDAWISGRKRFQATSRSAIPVFERDGAKIKLNPLALWSKAEVDAYRARHALPAHPLEQFGFLSIGCEPCTRAVADGEDPRAGRWAHVPDKQECGIHLGPDGCWVRAQR
jgi:phosphoadenosine phosphosulfate reductase